MSEKSEFISHEQFFTFYKDKNERYRYFGAAKEETTTLSLNLKDARRRFGLRQSDLDGLTQSEVSKIEKRDDIKLSTLIRYAEALGTSLKISLVDDDGEICVYGR